MQGRPPLLETLRELECEIRLLTGYARECCGCYEILRRKLDRLSGLIGEDCSRAQWQADSDDPALQALGLRLRDAAVQALCELEKHLCQGALHEPGEMGRYLGGLLESIRGELDSAGIDADARVLFVGSGALPTSALVLAREVGAHLCCLDIDEEALGCAREIARCQGLEARMQFSSRPPAELAFSRDATHFLIASLVQQKARYWRRSARSCAPTPRYCCVTAAASRVCSTTRWNRPSSRAGGFARSGSASRCTTP
ncbi:Uncharacterised protein [Pseudomonas aeruginosa]|nr:Uncharacterised protein [Pseudomonas aeruginosa]